MTFLGNDFKIMLDHTYTTEKYFLKKSKNSICKFKFLYSMLLCGKSLLNNQKQHAVCTAMCQRAY